MKVAVYVASDLCIQIRGLYVESSSSAVGHLCDMGGIFVRGIWQ